MLLIGTQLTIELTELGLRVLRFSYILNASLARQHSFLTIGDFCRLLIIFANLLTVLIVFLKEVVLKEFMFKKVGKWQQKDEKFTQQAKGNLPFSGSPKRVLLQTVKTQMKCSIMLHFIRVYTVCKGKNESIMFYEGINTKVFRRSIAFANALVLTSRSSSFEYTMSVHAVHAGAERNVCNIVVSTETSRTTTNPSQSLLPVYKLAHLPLPHSRS